MPKNNVIQMFPDIDCQAELESLSTLIREEEELGFLTYMSVVLNHLSGYMSCDDPEMFESAFRMLCAIKLAELHADSDDDEIH